jgi:hypothetical protein
VSSEQPASSSSEATPRTETVRSAGERTMGGLLVRAGVHAR